MKRQTYKRTGNCGLFDWEENTAKLCSLGNPLEKLLKVVDFEMFRETLEGGLYKEKLSNVGAKPYDYVLMFKILVLQRMYNLGDEQTEYQIVDRTSFRNFLGLASGDKVPDARTIWVFKNQLTEKHLFEKLFNDFDKLLRDNNLILNQGVIIDGSFVEIPRQRNTREDNKAIKKRHVFGYCEQSLHGMFSHAVGFARNAARNILTSLVYNMMRYEQIQRLGMN
ncbi:MAG: transposase [Bacteroidales bacterium]|nr:transposase [Bacteroidales bacterium]